MNVEAIAQEIERRKAANYSYLYLSDRPGDMQNKDNCIVHPVKKTWTKNIDLDKENVLAIIEAHPNPPHPYRLGFQRKARGVMDVVRIKSQNEETALEPAEPALDEIATATKEMDNTVRSFEQALADKAKIERLEYMVRERDRKISELEEELEALISEAQDEETAQLADGTVNLINQIAPLLPALADRYFSILEAKHKAPAADQRRPAPPAAEHQQAPQGWQQQADGSYEPEY